MNGLITFDASLSVLGAADLIGLLGGMGGASQTQLGSVGVLPFIILMTVSLFFSFIAMWMYSYFYASRATGSQIHRAFPLLSVSTTAIFICVQFSLPLSLGLLGALSIVRFRTPIKEPEEIGFIMFVIAGAISCATFNLVFLGILAVLCFLGLVFLNYGPNFALRAAGSGTIVATLPDTVEKDQRERILQMIQEKIPKARLDALRSSNGECIMSFVFPKLPVGMITDVEESVKTLVPGSSFQLFYNRSETIA